MAVRNSSLDLAERDTIATNSGRGGFVDAEDALISDGAREMETNITASTVLSDSSAAEAQRETLLLVYGEGYSYAEAASSLGVPLARS